MGDRDRLPGRHRPDARAIPQAEFDDEEMPNANEMSPEMATRVADFESMSHEERKAMWATAQAGGGVEGLVFPADLSPASVPAQESGRFACCSGR